MRKAVRHPPEVGGVGPMAFEVGLDPALAGNSHEQDPVEIMA